MILTNRLYKEGKYTEREAAIILTGFSSVSASFMISVAKTLGLLDIWITFFLTAMLVTYLVTAITVRLYPIRRIRDEYITGIGIPERKPEGNILKKAFREGLVAAENAGSLTGNIWKNLKDGMAMNFRLISTIISIGLISFVLVKTTAVFDYIGYIFYPFAYLVQVPNPELVAKLTAVAGAEMFIPSLTVAEVIGVAAQTKFIVGVLSISMILFFSGSIPCVLATEVRLGLKNLLIIMFERAVLSLLIAGAIAWLIF
jgi:nucleoside recognition membrane protein YjiH